MTLHIHTARISYAGADRLDITRKSAAGLGRMFSPSWAILAPVIDARKAAKAIRDRFEKDRQASLFRDAEQEHYCEGNMLEQATSIERAAYSDYVPAYVEEMRQSYRRWRSKWEELLARDSVTLCCYCTDPERCHRRILAEILAKLGAVDEGERQPGGEA